MTEPRTAAGKAHLTWLLAGDDVFPEDALAAVLAIEREAVKPWRDGVERIRNITTAGGEWDEIVAGCDALLAKDDGE
jgi:hypothetical protein